MEVFVRVNIIYLVVGIFSLLSAFTHTWNGLKNTLNVLNNTAIDRGTITVFTYVWHIIGAENVVIGIALIIISFIKNRENTKFTVWVIMAISITRLIIICIFTFLNNESKLSEILIDSIAMIVIIVLLFFGTKIKNKTM